MLLTDGPYVVLPLAVKSEPPLKRDQKIVVKKEPKLSDKEPEECPCLVSSHGFRVKIGWLLVNI